MIPYGKQYIDEDDIKAVADVLRSDWLTTGPKVAEFEEAFAQYVGAKYAVAVSSGTAALHAAIYALGIGSGDEVIVSPMTFAATANCVAYQGGTPIFADVCQGTLLIDPAKVKEKITPRTKAIIAVDYAGHPCDYVSLQKIADQNNLTLIADACHALGAQYKGHRVGSLADLNIFSFHPVKHITTGEGGMITTDNADYADHMKIFRNHGITTDHRQREKQGSWFYEMVDLGYNYRITDIHCALGISQLKKLPRFLQRRREIAKHYDKAFVSIPQIAPLSVEEDVLHAYHLYVVKADFSTLSIDRLSFIKRLRSKGIAVNVHYSPVHLHPFYKNRFGTGVGLCLVSEEAYNHILSLPIFPGMTDEDVSQVITSIKEIINQARIGKR